MCLFTQLQLNMIILVNHNICSIISLGYYCIFLWFCFLLCVYKTRENSTRIWHIVFFYYQQKISVGGFVAGTKKSICFVYLSSWKYKGICVYFIKLVHPVDALLKHFQARNTAFKKKKEEIVKVITRLKFNWPNTKRNTNHYTRK